MNFLDIPEGESVFIDANVFVYAFAADPTLGPPCRDLVERIGRNELEAPRLSLARNRRIIVPPVNHRRPLEVRAASQGPSQGNREEDFAATDETRMEHG